MHEHEQRKFVRGMLESREDYEAIGKRLGISCALVEMVALEIARHQPSAQTQYYARRGRCLFTGRKGAAS